MDAKSPLTILWTGANLYSPHPPIPATHTSTGTSLQTTKKKLFQNAKQIQLQFGAQY